MNGLMISRALVIAGDEYGCFTPHKLTASLITPTFLTGMLDIVI